MNDFQLLSVTFASTALPNHQFADWIYNSSDDAETHDLKHRSPTVAKSYDQPAYYGFNFFGWLDLVGLGWIKLGWIMLGWVRLGWIRLGWVRLGWVMLGWVRLGWVRLGWVRLGWVRLWWVGLGWVRFFIIIIKKGQQCKDGRE